MSQQQDKIYTQEQVDSIMSDLKTILLPQIRSASEAREKKVSGKGLSTNDYTDAEKTKLAGLGNYDDTALAQRVSDIEAIIGDASEPDVDSVINKVREMIDFFANVSESDTLASTLAALNTAIGGKYTKPQAGIPASDLAFGDFGASGANHAAGLVPDPGATAGTSKYLREDGTWAEPDVPAIEDFHEAVATLQSAPTSSTLTYTRDGQTCYYKIGDEVRVADAENGTDETNGYVFYTLYDLATASGTTTAYWALAGAGGGSGSAMGKITVRLKDLVNEVEQQSPSFAGIVVTLTNTTDSTTVGTKTLAAGETSAVFSGLVPLKNYSVGVSALDAQHTTPSAQTVTALGIGEEKELAFAYEADEYTVSVDSNLADKSDLGNVRVTVLGTEYADGATLRVAKGTAAGTPTASSVTGYSVTVAVSGKVITATYETDVYTLTVTGQNRSETIEYVQGGQTVSESVASGNSIKVPHGTSPTVASAYVKGYARTVTVGTVTSYAATIGVAYSTTAVAVAIQSNQDADATIGALRATVSWTYDGHSESDVLTAAQQTVMVPTGVTPTVTFPNAPTGYSRSISNDGLTATYSTTILTVTVAADTGSPDLSGVAVTVTDTTGGNAVAAYETGRYRVPTGHGYEVGVTGDVSGYTTPQAATGTASGTAAAVTMEYAKVTMLTGYIILDQTSSDPTTKVIDEQGNTYSGYQRPEVITAIRQASHCYVGTFANNKMTLRQLDDTDGTKYADGTSAATDIATVGKDVWMRLPYFFTRVSTVATDKVKIEFAYDPNQTATTTQQPDGSGWRQWGGNDLIGKYEAYEESNKTYSVSGKASTGNVSQADFKSHARARGTGFTLVKWRHQNLMAMLYYAYYGHTNCQSLIGSGANSYTKNTGLKNSLGMTDTTSANGNTDNIVFWGLENWWGNKHEWVDNVVVNHPTWTITEDDGSTRTVSTTDSATGTWIYAVKWVIGEHLDVIPAPGTTGGSSTTGYCDGQYLSASSSRVVRRSCSNSSAYGGVGFANAYSDASNAYADAGSRLAFTGEIEIS